MTEVQVVTGAFGYSGRHIAARLLERGLAVRTLTNAAPQRTASPAERIAVYPLAFDQPARLVAALRGATVLYNTYWVRFEYRDFNHATAIANTLRLFAAAKEAGVRRVVHVSITNPSADSPLPYFRGKAQLEQALMASGLSYAILRPAVLFGHDDILVNNIAWMLRRLPVFGIFGDGQYRLRPIHVEDFANLAFAQAAATENTIVDAVGPETFTYRGLVEALGRIIGHPRPIMSVAPAIGCATAWLLGCLVRDVVLTRDEIAGLMAGLLDTPAPATGRTALTDWATRHATTLGRRYASELARRRRREM